MTFDKKAWMREYLREYLKDPVHHAKRKAVANACQKRRLANPKNRAIHNQRMRDRYYRRKALALIDWLFT